LSLDYPATNKKKRREYIGIFKNGRRWMLVQLYRYSLPAELKGTAGHRTAPTEQTKSVRVSVLWSHEHEQ
jgi:hypothetical protein